MFHLLESVVDYEPCVAVVAEELLLRARSIVAHPFLCDIDGAAHVTGGHPNHPATIWEQ